MEATRCRKGPCNSASIPERPIVRWLRHGRAQTKHYGCLFVFASSPSKLGKTWRSRGHKQKPIRMPKKKPKSIGWGDSPRRPSGRPGPTGSSTTSWRRRAGTQIRHTARVGRSVGRVDKRRRNERLDAKSKTESAVATVVR